MQSILNAPVPAFYYLQKLTITVLALLVTFALFALMAQLVAHDKIAERAEPAAIPASIIFEEKEETTTEKARLPETPKPRTLPKTPTHTPLVTEIATGIPNIEDVTGVPPMTISTNLGASLTDQSARLIVQIEPSYPVEAAREGIEGWVSLQFTISPLGSVTDIIILDSQPKRVFDRAARQALSKWKYQPTRVNGTVVSQPKMQVILEFKLTQ